LLEAIEEQLALGQFVLEDEPKPLFFKGVTPISRKDEL